MNKPLVKLEAISKVYQQGQRQQSVLNDLTLTIPSEEKLMLVGRSGSGKSTLLNLLAGIDNPTTGNITYHVEDQVFTDFSRQIEYKRTVFRRRNIGFIFQFFNLIPTLTVKENVLLPLELNRLEHKANHAIERLHQLGLANRLQAFPEQLSGGEQQRVAIARALAHDPVLILADEPTGNLDENTGNQVMQLLMEQLTRTKTTLVMVTHSLEIAKQGDRILELQSGQLVSLA